MPNFQVASLLVLKRCVPGTIVHPKATIFAIAGPIVIGMGCIIEEGAIIVNRYVLIKRSTSSYTHIYPSCTRRKEVMKIGDENLFEIGCRAYFYS